jgi:hypothetical protein
MRTSLNEIREIESFHFGKLTPEDTLVFEARLITNKDTETNHNVYKKLLTIIKLFYRKKLKQEAETVSIKLFTDPSNQEFQKKISQLFNP